MQLTPMYDGASPLAMDGPVDAIREPLIRQRSRLGERLATLTDEQWQSASRCEGWSAQDVIAHLIGTNQFWSLSIGAGLAGEPTRILASFDPAATPPKMVEPMRSLSPTEVLDQFVTTNEQLFDLVGSLDDAGWARPAEAPPGHVPVNVVAHHALWDAWVHERDIFLPLGIEPDCEADEITLCLRYVAAIAPVLSLSTGAAQRGALVIEALDPAVRVVVEVDDTVSVHGGTAPPGAVTITGDAVELVEALTIRRPLEVDVPDDARWLLTGLAEAFDSPVQA
jgi:uncharacterized protein (TIGR03083 family)